MATLMRFDPLRDVAQLHDEMSRLFDDQRRRGEDSFGWSPAVDIFEDTDGVTLKFDLPEVDAKDVDVRLENGVLTIRGERKLEREDQKTGYHRLERSHGTFQRSFTLPGTLDVENVSAESKNGVLRIHVPRRAEAKPKSIHVKVN